MCLAMKPLRLLALALAAALCAQAGAQSYVGVRYGAGISTIYFLPHSGETWRLTPCNAGLTYRYYASREHHTYFSIGLQAELNYALRRYRFNDQVQTDILLDDNNYRIDTINKKIHSRVVELPVIMQWQFPITQNFRLYLNGLVYAAYYLKNEAYYTGGDGQAVVEEFDYKNWDNFDFGIGGGLGAGYVIGGCEIGIEARFLMGISELYPQAPSRYESLPQQILLSFSIVKKLGKGR